MDAQRETSSDDFLSYLIKYEQILLYVASLMLFLMSNDNNIDIEFLG